MARLTLILCAALLLGGCDREAKQNAADAIAGTNAVLGILSRAQIETGVRVAVQAILAGVQGHVRATVGDAELPPPRMSPEQIEARPLGYQEQGEQAQQDSRGGLWLWLLGGATALAAALRAIPGTAGWVSSIVHSILANKSDRRVKERADALQDGMRNLILAVESAPPEVAGPIKAFVSKKVPELAPVIRDLTAAKASTAAKPAT